ncbi:hypothetical protein JMJ35_006614 [Cladonia borealis]|uniref:Heterokaryon incompatibility domain-containing protein n=1 Tax=Cladonia borealis TaxID=184061 RepID=A0AA39V0L3_9LECA|nr:hypothetical protein JMJ35_006614 [Cladonia borealis]
MSDVDSDSESEWPPRSPDIEVTFEIPLSSISASVPLDISPAASPGHFRFLDCRALVDDSVLRVVTLLTTDISTISYSAISYPWRGNPADDILASSFSVKGAESGDPISLAVLRSACIASLSNDGAPDEVGARPNPKLCVAPYLWLDRLCILQSSKQDKTWQIKHMFSLYKNCTQCLVLPGGLRRLVGLDETTAWVQRAWTLQEALAPRASFVLFAWQWETGFVASSSDMPSFKLREVVRGERGKKHWVVPARILGGSKAPSLFALSSAYESVGRHRERGIWQSSFCRTSSRPVDIVFSIMGLFGVELDPEAFGVDDRVRATMALAQGILRKGGTAQWIGIGTRASPCEQLSTFPSFPQTTVSGPGKLQTWDGELVLSETAIDADSLDDLGVDSDSDDDSDRGQALPMLEGKEMDDDGYLLVAGRGCVVSAATADAEFAAQSEGRFARAVDGTRWEFLGGGPQAVTIEEADFPRSVAIFIAKFSEGYDYTDISDDSGDKGDGSASSSDALSESDLDACKFMLVIEHAPARFHVASYFYLREDFGDKVWPRKMHSWDTCNVLVGGPRVASPVLQPQ